MIRRLRRVPARQQDSKLCCAALIAKADVRLDLSLVELIPRFAHDERSVRGGFDKSPIQQFHHCARLDWVAIWLPLFLLFVHASGDHGPRFMLRSEEHTSELQSLRHLVCRLLLEKKFKYVHLRGFIRRCLSYLPCSLVSLLE